LPAPVTHPGEFTVPQPSLIGVLAKNGCAIEFRRGTRPQPADELRAAGRPTHGPTSTRQSILGSLRSAGGKGVVRIEDRYGTGIDDLWSALTDPSRLANFAEGSHQRRARRQ